MLEELVTEEPVTEQPEAEQSEADAPTAAGASIEGACNHPYYPIRDGAVYRYQMTAPGMDAAEMTIVFSVTGPDSFVTTQTFSGITTETTWQCTADGLLRTDLGLGIPEMPGLEYSVDGVTGVTFPPPDQLTEGATWQNTFNMSGQMSMEGLSLKVSIDSLTDNRAGGLRAGDDAGGDIRRGPCGIHDDPSDHNGYGRNAGHPGHGHDDHDVAGRRRGHGEIGIGRPNGRRIDDGAGRAGIASGKGNVYQSGVTSGVDRSMISSKLAPSR